MIEHTLPGAPGFPRFLNGNLEPCRHVRPTLASKTDRYRLSHFISAP
jgi:hypothetical protein